MTDGVWDFQVERVNLVGLSIDAGQRLGMVIVQPTYNLILDGQIPFRISEEDREAQKALIEMAFKIRAEESQERNVPIPFILFPETAIPAHDPDGLDFLRQQMERVQEDVIFIGGLEGLSPEEVREMVGRFPSVATLGFGAGTFVNVCVIAVKSANGPLSWHFQAKLRPSKWEQPRNMAHGQRILYFVALHVAFMCQICFDHIAAQGEEPLNSVLCRQLIESAQPNAATLDFVFVPQCNPQPDHESVTKNTGFLLNYDNRGLKNDMATVVVVNKAASVQEPSEYGKSGFHYKVKRWDVPTSDLGPKGYEFKYDLDHAIASAIFRKRTQAIHVATLVPPAHNVGKSENPRLPLENPRSYLIKEGCDPTQCLCLPGTTRGVGMFVECDCLPCKLRDALLADLPTKDEKKRWKGSDAGQTQLLERHYGEMRKDLLMLGCDRTRELIHLLLLAHEDKHTNPDLWSDLQFEAVVELLAALSVLAEMQPVNYNATPQWTAWLGEKVAVALLDGAGKMHWEEMEAEYIREFEARYYKPEVRRIPVLLTALRSRGLIEPFVKLTSPSFTKSTDPNKLGDEKSYARPAPIRIYVCQDTLFEGARQAERITDFLKEKMRCILG